MGRKSFSSRKTVKRIFIFHEGKTEGLYFCKIRQLFRGFGVTVKPISIGSGSNLKDTRKLNEHIKQELNKDIVKGIKLTTKVFIVFDIDIFSSRELDELYAGIMDNVILIPTNQIFEYWILLHFQDFRLSNAKRDYLRLIRTHVTIEKDKFTGKKDLDWMTKESVLSAVDRAIIVSSTYSSRIHLKNKDPISEVPKIINELT